MNELQKKLLKNCFSYVPCTLENVQNTINKYILWAIWNQFKNGYSKLLKYSLTLCSAFTGCTDGFVKYPDDIIYRAQKQFLLIYKYVVPLNLESLSVQQKQVAIMKGERKDKSKAHSSYNLKSVVLACACQILFQNFFQCAEELQGGSKCMMSSNIGSLGIFGKIYV